MINKLNQYFFRKKKYSTRHLLLNMDTDPGMHPTEESKCNVKSKWYLLGFLRHMSF